MCTTSTQHWLRGSSLETAEKQAVEHVYNNYMKDMCGEDGQHTGSQATKYVVEGQTGRVERLTTKLYEHAPTLASNIRLMTSEMFEDIASNILDIPLPVSEEKDTALAVFPQIDEETRMFNGRTESIRALDEEREILGSDTPVKAIRDWVQQIDVMFYRTEFHKLSAWLHKGVVLIRLLTPNLAGYRLEKFCTCSQFLEIASINIHRRNASNLSLDIARAHARISKIYDDIMALK